ncbi:MAG: MATE family efflux transporter [Fidelibacterota bacterium]
MKTVKPRRSRLQQFLNNPSRALWTLALPIMAGIGIQTLYNLVDMIFIGRLKGHGIAAVAFNMPLFFLVLGLTMGLGSGVTSAIAQFIGAKDKVNADNAAEHALMMGLVISTILASIGLIYGREILAMLGATAELLPLSWSYLQVICLGLPFMVFSAFFRSILAGEGDMQFPMIVAALGTLLNIILDPIFIFVLELGVRGAAVATVISQACVFAIFVFMLFVKEHSYITFRLRDFSFSGHILGSIIRIGLPASMSMIIMSIGQGIFNKILISYSPETVAAYQIGGRVDMLIFLPIMSIAAALMTIVGMFFGAREYGKLKFIVRYGMLRSVFITLLTSATVFILAPVLVRIFTPVKEIQEMAQTYLRLIALVYPLIAVGMTSGRVLQGLGRGLPLLVITSVRVLLVSSFLAWMAAFVFHKPIEWVWYSMMTATVVSATISLTWVRWSFKRLPVEAPQTLPPMEPEQMLLG